MGASHVGPLPQPPYPQWQACSSSKVCHSKTSHEQLSFQSSQVSSGSLAEAPLLSAGFLAIAQLCTQVAPPLIIRRLQILWMEGLLRGSDRCDDANRAAHHVARNSATSPRGSALMRTGDAKTMRQVVSHVLELFTAFEIESMIITHVGIM